MMKKVFLGCFLLGFAIISSFANGKYKLGDVGPGGGIVFYVSEEGFTVHDGKGGKQICHYLEMMDKTLGKCYWLPDYVDVGGTETGLGYGKANTYKILELEKSRLDLDDLSCAAYAVREYSNANTKKGDWWLPSKDELLLMYKTMKERVRVGHEKKENVWHWSSSETESTHAWTQGFKVGDRAKEFKCELCWVRGIRAF